MSQPNSHSVFVDTSAFFAAVNRRDANFVAAQEILARLGRERAQLVTTTYVVAEAHALFLRKLGRDPGVGFLRRMDRGAATVVHPAAEDEATAREIIYRYTDKTFSLTDALSFAVMEGMGIPAAFTFDRDFEQYGLTVLRP